MVDSAGFEPAASGLQSQRSYHLSYEPFEVYDFMVFEPKESGGDLAAGSPTATLLRLYPPCRTWIRIRQ
jgi:hypothetical protein